MLTHCLRFPSDILISHDLCDLFHDQQREIFILQFSLFCIAHYHKFQNLPQRALQSVHIRHPCPRTSHRIRKNSPKIEKNLHREKSEEPFRRATEEDPSPGWTEE